MTGDLDDDLGHAIACVMTAKLDPADKVRLTRLLVLTSMRAEQMTAAELREARENAGLSVGQAAKLLWLEPGVLEEVEAGFPTLRGIGCWQPGLWVRMDKVYGLGDVAGRNGERRR